MSNQNKPLVSVVMPCLNEEETLPLCIEKITQYFNESGVEGEIVVADNGSTDNSKQIARDAGVVLVEQPKKGYGNAYHAGIAAARGEYIIIGDSDNTYDFLAIDDFLKPLQEGYDFVIGNRFSGMMEDGAMPWLHRYIGNPILSGILRVLFNLKIRDAHCGMRGFTREAYDRMNLQTTGMEYASEMVIAAVEEDLKIKEVPIRYLIRKGESKLDSFSDGWRHLRFMLVYSPNYVFILPGFISFVLGVVVFALLYPGPREIFGQTFDFHPLFLASAFVSIGVQLLLLGLFTKMYSYLNGFSRRSVFDKRLYEWFTLEKGLFLGSVIGLAGLAVAAWVVYEWGQAGFGELSEIRNGLLSLTVIMVGAQIFFSSFFMSLLSIHTKAQNEGY